MFKFGKPKKELESRSSIETVLAIDEVEMLLRDIGILDFRHENHVDGLHFFIKKPPKYIQAQHEQANRFGAMEEGGFRTDKLIPFKKALIEQNIEHSFTDGNIDDDEVEVLIPVHN